MLSLAIRTMFTGSRLIFIVFPDISWFLKYRIEYLTLYLASAFFVSFLYHIYKKDISRKITQIIVFISLIYSLSLFASPAFFTKILFSFQILLLLAIVYYIYGFTIIVIRKRNGGRILAFSIAVFFSSVVHDILFTRGIIINSIELLPFGTFIFILGQSLVLAKIFNRAFTTNEIRISLSAYTFILKNLKVMDTSVDNELKSLVDENLEASFENFSPHPVSVRSCYSNFMYL